MPGLSAYRARCPCDSPSIAPCGWQVAQSSVERGAVGMGCAGGTWMGQLSALNPAWFSLCVQRDTGNAFASKKHLLLIR